MKEFVIKLDVPDILELIGLNDQKFKLVKSYFPEVQMYLRGDELKIIGESQQAMYALDAWENLIQYAQHHSVIEEDKIKSILNNENPLTELEDNNDNLILFGRNNKPIKAKTPTQLKLKKAVQTHDIIFAIGPAGTGKTYTSVALAVKALKNKEVKKIILTRPAVEAGENLGFLPGDMREKIDPYLRPLYDALDDMLSAEKLGFYLEKKIIEIAPLAFMRGRTLDDAYVILDEAQNCSNLQIKMFLTRMGPNAKFIVNGDLTQIDLPGHQKSGLIKATRILKNIKGITILEFDVNDVTRHRIVKEIINAYSIKEVD